MQGTAKITLEFNKEQLTTFKEMLELNYITCASQLAQLDEALKTVTDAVEKKNLMDYRQKVENQVVLAMGICDSIVEAEKEKPRIIIPNGRIQGL